MRTPTFNGKRYTPFHYALISDGSKLIYKLIREAILDCKPSLGIPNFTKKVDYGKILINVLNDSPFIFWVDSAVSVSFSNAGTTVSFSYNNMMCKKDEYLNLIIEKAQGYFDACVTETSKDYDIALAVHDLMSKKITYDINSANTVNINKSFFSESHSLIGPLLYNTGVCEGISDAYTYILNCCGIKTASVWGQIHKNNKWHAWNVVYLDHEWYHVDVTWDLTEKCHFTPHGNFGLEDREIQVSRTYVGYIPCLGKKYNYFLQNGTRFENIAEMNHHLSSMQSKSAVEFYTTYELNYDDIHIRRCFKISSFSNHHHYIVIN